MKFYNINCNKYIYECKCLYFWENILKFKGNFTTEEKTKFSLCNWRCKYQNHQVIEYCQLPLWHSPTNKIPKEIYGKWISQGHVFKCFHDIGVSTIFLIDESGSMSSQSIKPNNIFIRIKMNNMIGACN